MSVTVPALGREPPLSACVPRCDSDGVRLLATASSLAPTSCLCIACDGFGGVALVFVVHLRGARVAVALVLLSLDASVRSPAAIACHRVAEDPYELVDRAKTRPLG
jgi:hypothetical protein